VANGADTITGFTVGAIASGGDVLVFSSLTSGTLANVTSDTAITLATATQLATAGTPITVANNQVYVAKVTNVADIDSAAEVAAALADTGILSAVDVAVGSPTATAFLILSGADNTTTAYVYGVTNDATAAIGVLEVNLVGTITTNSTTFTTANIAFS
jgi:hypothetical protein